MSSVPTLQEMAFSRIAVEYFEDPHPPEEAHFAGLLRNVFHHMVVENQEQRMQAIKDRVIADLQAMLTTAYQDDSQLAAMKAELLPNGTFGNRWLLAMYEQGSSCFNWYVQFHYNGIHRGMRVYPERRESLTQLCQEWFKKVTDDFEARKPHSFPQMADWIHLRNITSFHPLTGSAPFDRVERFMPLLLKMAYLGVEKAQFALAFAYGSNQVGDIDQPIYLGLTRRARIMALKTLANWGSAFSQYELGSIYYYNDFDGGFGRDLGHLSEEERRRGMQELIEKEVGSNFYVTAHFAKAKIGKLACNYSVEERLAHLTEKAKRGDEEAFSILWDWYATDKLLGNRKLFGDREEEIPLQLDEKQRWDKLQELRTAESAYLYRNCYAGWVIEPTELLPCRMTRKERMAYLETLAFEERGADHVTIDRLEECYMNNTWEEEPLDLSFPDRLEKLKLLTTIYGSGDAIRGVALYYLPEWEEQEEEVVFQKKRIAQIPDEAIEDRDAKSFQERWLIVFELALRAKHWDFICHRITPRLQEGLLKEVFELAMNHLEALRFYRED